MAKQSQTRSIDIRPVLENERARIVRLCAHLTGDSESAEDLAQEVLLEAWRHADNLRDVTATSAWLSGIARNVCLRWNRRRSREPRVVSSQGPRASSDLLELLADDADLEVDLEQNDIARLLDQALALLPRETREALVARYLRESSYAVIAGFLSVSDGAVATRLHRGKAQLKRILTTDLRDEVMAMQWIDQPDRRFQETALWCSFCGQHHLYGFFDPAGGDLALRCPGCHSNYGMYATQTFGMPVVFGGADSLPAAYEHLVTAASSYFLQALSGGSTQCIRCGSDARVLEGFPPRVRLSTVDSYGMHVQCSACADTMWASLSGILLGLPDMQAFRRAHKRIRTLPQRHIVIKGRPAVLVEYESLGHDCHEVFVVMRDTYEIVKFPNETPLPQSI